MSVTWLVFHKPGIYITLVNYWCDLGRNTVIPNKTVRHPELDSGSSFAS